MDILFVFTVSFVLLLSSVIKGYFIAYPLLLTLGILGGFLTWKGASLKALIQMGIASSRKSFSVLSILLLIGATTAVWMAAGTVPALVYYGVKLIHPQWFILATFVLTSFVSLLLGTSFGTVSTIGIALMIMANGSDVNPHLIAGAIIAGAYFGDRCSPMSSSANLVAAVTQTQLYTNIHSMWKTSLLPLTVALLGYSILSWFHPVHLANPIFLDEFTRLFKIDAIDLLPAVTIMGLALLQIEVKRSMLASMGMAAAIALLHQHYPLVDLLRTLIFGFHLQEASPLQAILLGGGILSMVKVSIVVVISTALAGILAGSSILQRLEQRIDRLHTRNQCFLSTCLIGIGSAAFGCTQTIAILLTQQLMQNSYQVRANGNAKLALDLENTVVVIAPLIPWNIAGLIPASILNTDAGFIPFALYLYLLPLLNFLHLHFHRPPHLPSPSHLPGS
jgi:NhaC family Na+:H+ antiporter